MIRNFKTLGLAVLAVMAFGALAASSASAVEFTADKYPVTLHGENPIEKEKFITEAGNVECDSSFHAVATEASSTLTVNPTYTNCKAFTFLNATVSMEGCDYVFTATEGSGDHWKAHVDVVCPAGKSIKIVAATCTATVPAQTGLTTVDITLMTNAGKITDVTVTATTKGIKYNVTNDGFGCPFSGTGEKTGAEYLASEPVTITGLEPGTANKINIGVS